MEGEADSLSELEREKVNGTTGRASEGAQGTLPLQSSFSAGCQPRWGEAALSPLISVDQLEKVSSPVDCEGR